MSDAEEWDKKLVYLSRYWYKPPTTVTVGDASYKNFKEERKMDDEKAKLVGFGSDGVSGIYKVYFFYGGKGNRVFKETTVVADSVQDAKVKSGFHDLVSHNWDGQYLTFYAVLITTVQREE